MSAPGEGAVVGVCWRMLLFMLSLVGRFGCCHAEGRGKRPEMAEHGSVVAAVEPTLPLRQVFWSARLAAPQPVAAGPDSLAAIERSSSSGGVRLARGLRHEKGATE